MADVFARRNDIQALELGVKMYEQKQRIAQSAMMPNLAVIGSYMFSNPNMYNGFQKNLTEHSLLEQHSQFPFGIGVEISTNTKQQRPM